MSTKFINDGNKTEMHLVEKFIYSLGIIVALRDRAWSRAAFIEYIVLSCTQVDAMLRWAIVLKEQVDNKNSEINEMWLTKNMKERTLFDIAVKRGVIEKNFADNLHRLYKNRNDIIHRFIITDIDYEFGKRIASGFEPMIEKLKQKLYEIEEQQIEKQVGITRKGKVSESVIKDKLSQHFKFKLGDTPQRIDQVREHKWLDVEDIVEFASREGFLNKCKKCNHIKALHYDFENAKSDNLEEIECNCKHEGCDCFDFVS